jgi:putative ABC transport system permease protein
MWRKIPLAWLQLTREKPRLIVALAGIAFADFLMFMQLAFREALFESNVRLHTSLEGEVVLINPQSNAVNFLESFSQRRLYQALDLKEVASVHPIYVGLTSWKNPQTRRSSEVQVIAANPNELVFNLPGMQQNLKPIKMPDVVLFDRGSRPDFGPIATDFDRGKKIETEVGGRRIRVGGVVELGASFGSDGNIVTSDLNFFRLFKNRKAGLIDIGLIKLKPGANPETVVAQLRQYLPKDIQVLSKQEFIQKEKDYWATSTPIGFIFALGTVMGFIVGTVIVYQILYSEVSDHLSEYATLKAMGYSQTYLLLVVFQEAFILASLGYIPGFGFAVFLYSIAKNATLLPIYMTVSRAILVFLLTMLMCFISGLISVRKLQAADPADVF